MRLSQSSSTALGRLWVFLPFLLHCPGEHLTGVRIPCTCDTTSLPSELVSKIHKIRGRWKHCQRCAQLVSGSGPVRRTPGNPAGFCKAYKSLPVGWRSSKRLSESYGIAKCMNFFVGFFYVCVSIMSGRPKRVVVSSDVKLNASHPVYFIII